MSVVGIHVLVKVLLNCYETLLPHPPMGKDGADVQAERGTSLVNGSGVGDLSQCSCCLLF